MARRTMLILALGFALLASGPVTAAPPAQIVDTAGDANAVNGQGLQTTASRAVDDRGGVVTPMQPDKLKAFDILSVRFATEFINQRKTAYKTVTVKAGRKRVTKRVAYTVVVKKPNALLVTMTLAGDPLADPIPKMYRVYFFTGDCAVRHMLTWNVTPTNPDGVPDSTGSGDQGVAIWTRGASFYRADCFNTGIENTDLPSSRSTGDSLIFRLPLNSFARVGTKVHTMSAESRLRARAAYPYPTIDFAWAKESVTYVTGK